MSQHLRTFPPPSSPWILHYAPPSLRADLRQIVVRRRGITTCAIGYAATATIGFFTPPELRSYGTLLSLVAILTVAVLVFNMSIGAFSKQMGILLGVLGFVPLFGLLVLLIINRHATALLRSHGIKAGAFI